MEGRPLKEGDLIPVQIERDAVQEKGALRRHGPFLYGPVSGAHNGKEGIFFSSRIRDEERRKALRELLSREEHFYRLIVRTNAQDAPKEAVLHELHALRKQAEEILSLWKSRMPGALLYEPDPPYFSQIFNNRLHFWTRWSPTKKRCTRQFPKESPASSRRTAPPGFPPSPLQGRVPPFQALFPGGGGGKPLKERVWLDSGGFLVIQPTEALVSIDVNTGKYAGKKSLEETFFKSTWRRPA